MGGGGDGILLISEKCTFSKQLKAAVKPLRKAKSL